MQIFLILHETGMPVSEGTKLTFVDLIVYGW